MAFFFIMHYISTTNNMSTEIPIATQDNMDRFSLQRSKILEIIKDLKLAFVEFCGSIEEAEEILSPIETDPHAYASGAVKTRPILMKYAKNLVELEGVDTCIKEESVRDIGHQMKALLKFDLQHAIRESVNKAEEEDDDDDPWWSTFTDSEADDNEYDDGDDDDYSEDEEE